jgi:PTS system galactitol-specific IIB component
VNELSVVKKAKKTVLVACGTGIATSTVVSDAIEKMAKENNIQIEIVQCKVTEVPAYESRASLLVTTTIVSKQYPFPIINARAFLTGIGLDKLKEQILEELKK